MSTALIIGGNGQIGVPASLALAADGWQVRVLHRGSRPLEPDLVERGVREVRGDRDDETVLAAAVGDGVDLLVDCVAFNSGHAEQVLRHRADLGSAVVISSAAVCADGDGRYLGGPEFPHLDVGRGEDGPTAEPGLGGYASGKVELEQAWLAADIPATVLRPGAIHGRLAQNPREWFALKRVLDGRTDVVLAHEGRSQFHTSAVENIAELIRLAAARPGRRVLNAVDPQAPTTTEIVTAVYAARSRDVTVHPMPGEPEGNVGLSPWGVPVPFVFDMSRAAADLGYRPVTDYAASLGPYLDWIERAATERDWREAFAEFAAGGADLFDYAAEDAWLAARR
ncbi:NAD-dependent epimerase/dehydratase family protein [Occultella gossypii]|uniref:NmrA family NAD(P)-binding protein n=1 Tax=Occultella gossypii TaxID=2800820 RepID=A0ABS7SD00_9MICO|nr:NAD-dependent epimerase/dehydratase family protein [Occultella gossypii]MBZ2197589.1 NmrA family NAD(P)-binding protein [Occultella gossypii]